MESENSLAVQMLQEPCAAGLSVIVNPARPILDIVFVHGFTGHPQRTWSQKQGANHTQNEDDNDDDGERPSKFRKLLSSASHHQGRSGVSKPTYWPRDLIPITVPNARVLTYGYDTHIRHWADSAIDKSTVYDIAWNFLVSLEAERRVEPSRPLLFVAHSLGGIVVKEALRRSRGCETHQSHLYSIYNSTYGIIFFGTPHGGADPRGLIQHIVEQTIRAMGFKVNEQIVNTLLPSAERLKELRDEFGPMARQNNWTIYSFQEQYGVKALGNKKVVEDTASCLNDPTIEVTQHIARNHMEMCRFSGLDDVEYKKLARAIDRVLEVIARLVPLDKNELLDADQRQRLLDCLKFDQIDARQTTIKTAHAKTCKWLLNKPEYQDWLDVDAISNHHGFLWIKGNPGTGKSTMMKFVCANAKKTLKETVVISFFFNARGDYLEKSGLGMYRSLLYQLLEKLPDLQDLFDSLPLSTPDDLDRWDIEVFKNIFALAIENLGQRHLVCFIDALDECDEDQVREIVACFERLGQFAVSSKIQFHVCFSSRHYPHITIEKGVHLVLEGQEGHSQDIVNYLSSELKAGRSKLIEDIRKEILERSSGIFLWVILVVQMLNKEFDRGRIHALRKRLDEIPNKLDELFQDILTRDGQNMEELILCLQWVLYAKRPLKREELYFAILAGLSAEKLKPWNREEITEEDMERFVLNSSKGLAHTTKSKHQTVQFIHESVRDFLLTGNGLNKLRSHLESNFPGSSHERLKECCHNYMRIDVAPFEDAANFRQAASAKLPFLEYAVHHILHHADAANGYGISQIWFMENFSLRDWIILDNLFEKHQIRRHTIDCSLLYILAEQNLPNLIQIELNRVQNMDIKGERYGFPLNAAVAHGNDNTIRALLTPVGTWHNGDIPHTACLASTIGMYQDSIKFLLGCRGDVNTRKPRTMLSLAAESGNETVVRRLIETTKVDLDSKESTNKREWNGRTPLSLAATGGHETIVRLLLATGQVHVDSKDGYDRTPLSWAAAGGHDAVVQLLLETGQVDLDLKDGSNRTPLSLAAAGGHDAVVQLLLETGQVDMDLKDGSNRTPLSWAAAGGHDAVVRLLLETGQVHVDSKDKYDRTPLSLAAAGGHDAVVQLLLETGQVDVDSKDKSGQTPLFWAAVRGHDAVVQLLLETGQVDVDSKDRYDQTPLSWAAAGGHDAVVRLLLETGQVDVDLKVEYGQTPLYRAAAGGHDAVVRLLLETGQVDVDLKDKFGQTPLSLAAVGGHGAVVRLLLEAGQGDINFAANDGRTPLSVATENSHRDVALLLTSLH